MEYIFDSFYVQILFLFLYSVVFAFCFFGNLAVVLVVTLHWRMRNTTKFCLGNLAFANLCVGVFCIYQNLSTYLMDSWIFGLFLCKMYHFINSLSHTASILILVVLCLERYLAILHPFKCRQVLTINILRLIIIGVWFLSAIICSPKLYYITTYEIPTSQDTNSSSFDVICAPQQNLYDTHVADMIYFILLFLLPLLIISILYTRVGIFLWKSSIILESLSVQGAPGNLDQHSIVTPSASMESKSSSRKRSHMFRQPRRIRRVIPKAFCRKARNSKSPSRSLSLERHSKKRLSAKSTPTTSKSEYRTLNSSICNQGSYCSREPEILDLIAPEHIKYISVREEKLGLNCEISPNKSNSRCFPPISNGKYLPGYLNAKKDSMYNGSKFFPGKNKTIKKGHFGLSVRRRIDIRPKGLKKFRKNVYLQRKNTADPRYLPEFYTMNEMPANNVELSDVDEVDQNTPLCPPFVNGRNTNFRTFNPLSPSLKLRTNSKAPLNGCSGNSLAVKQMIRDNQRRIKFQKSRQAVVRMLIAIVVTFAVCNLPFHLRKICQNYLDWYDMGSNLSVLVTCVTFLFMYANCAINPILYAFMSKNFRVSLWDLVEWSFRRRRRDSNALR